MVLNLNSSRLNELKLKNSTVYHAALIDQLFTHLPFALFANLILSLLLVFILWSEISHQKLAIWIIAIWVLSLGRFIHYLIRPKVNFPVKRSACFFSIGILSTGLVWGASAIFLFAENSFPHQVFVAFVLGGLAAGATTSVAGLQWVFRIFVCLLMVPISVRFFLIGGPIYSAMGTMLVIYGVICSVMSTCVYKMLLAAIHLNQENKQEIEERKKAEAELITYKNQLEETVKKRTAELEEEIDIRMQVETELLKSNERYHQITSNLPGLVYQFMRHNDGTYSMPYISDGVQPMFGVTTKNVIKDAHSILKFVHPDDYHDFEHSIEISTKNLSLYNHDFRAMVNGEELWLNAKASPKRLVNGDTLWDGILFDITARKKMDKEKIFLETQLQQAHKLEAVGVFAGGIAHDFNNLLTAILGNINLAFFDNQLSIKTKKLLSAAEKASLRAKDLTSQLLTFAKGGAPVKQISSLKDVIIDSADFVIQGSSVACQYAIPQDLWLADIDKGQISQVIQNIVINSSQAMPEGGTIKIRCENCKNDKSGLLLRNPAKKQVKISIQDSGTGIPVNIIEKIFDPYFSTKIMEADLGWLSANPS